jgi:predicted dithiol-disulfide oxidoreductase (DUF899 family)
MDSQKASKILKSGKTGVTEHYRSTNCALHCIWTQFLNTVTTKNSKKSWKLYQFVYPVTDNAFCISYKKWLTDGSKSAGNLKHTHSEFMPTTVMKAGAQQ